MIDGKEYGKALFLLTEERGSTERVLGDVRTVRAVLENCPQYAKLQDTPALTVGEKISLLDEAFGSLDDDLCHLLDILTEKRAFYQTVRVLDAFVACYEHSRGIERVEAVTAVPMTDAQKDAMTKKLAAMTGKTILLRNTVDRSILGGVRLRYLGMQLDSSLKTRLDTLEEKLRSTII